ncbi:MAG: TetR/AcrR family transcriptional regulator [Paracoccaceae bacterium]
MSSNEPDTRTRILAASMKLLESAPTKLPRMSDIAKAAGISRQALYLHFDSRTDLLVETTRYQDHTNNADQKLMTHRNKIRGRDKLDAFVLAWGNYIPEIWGVARALVTLSATEPEAAAALDQRMADVRQGFEAAIKVIDSDGDLPPALNVTLATDLVAMLMSFRNWETLTQSMGWTQDCYVETMRAMAQAAVLGDMNALSTALTCTEHLDPSGHPA